MEAGPNQRPGWSLLPGSLVIFGIVGACAGPGGGAPGGEADLEAAVETSERPAPRENRAAPGDYLEASSTTRLILLGTGTPNAEPDRAGSAVAVVVNGTPYLVDAGPGVVRRANQANQNGEVGLAPKNLATVFLTHLHSDHTLGLPDLVFTPWTLEREAPLKVFGPPGTEDMAFHIREAYRADIQNRVDGLEPANTTGHMVEARDVQPGMVFEDGNVRVFAFAVAHGSWPLALGYRFETPDRTIVISGDTSPTGTVAENCRGCDILVHEAYAQAGFVKRDSVWQRYHAAAHTSGPELGRIAAQAQPRLLVLTHQLLWMGATQEDLLEEIRMSFEGPIAFGKDLDVF